MILAFDTYYFDGKAKTVCIEFTDWSNSQYLKCHTETLENIEEYIPGEFYKRELPCILSLLNKISPKNAEAIIVDGYVFLTDEGKPGLGGHLYNALKGNIPVIGVAKTNFKTIEKLKRQVLRGDSNNPQFVTAIGIDVDIASENVRGMSGPFRIPTLLKQLDQMTKEV